MISLSQISQRTNNKNNPLVRHTYLVLTPSSAATIHSTIPVASMASTSRSASPSTEGEYDILTPSSSSPNTAKELSAHHKFCVDIAELERWAPTIGRLRDDEMAQMSQFFRQKTYNLAKYLPTGTGEQQFEALERLTKLRGGLLGIRMNRASKASLNMSIKLRIGALSGEVPLLDHEVC